MINPGDEDHTNSDENWEEEQQFDLADDDEDLPWLEGEDYDDEGGIDFRLVWIALIGFVVIAAILFAAWWFTRDSSDGELVADGSTIEAPEGAYKQRPDDPGGAEVAGTGDQAFEVAEGGSTRGRIASDDGGDSDPQPSIDRDQASSSGSEDAPVSTGGAYVQIGAFGSRSDAETAWSRESGRYSALSGLRHRVVEAEVNGANVYRLQAIASDRNSAETICRSVRNSGGDCIVR